MLDVAQEELTGETLGEQRLCQGRAILMPQFVGDTKKRLLKNYGERVIPV